MKKYIWYILMIALIAAAVIMILLSPDIISTTLTVVMTVVTGLSVWFGVVPLIRYNDAFTRGQRSIRQAMDQSPENPWTAVLEMRSFFRQHDLDELFEDYRSKVQTQHRSGVVVTDIDDIINENMLSLKTWQGVIRQIPGTLTGLGILGTFIGLILGIRGIHFDTMQTAIDSIQGLLGGIEVAFFTSIAGVILSILFNTMNNIIWNSAVRELGLFTTEFKRCIIPSEDEQARYRQKRELQKILERLDRLPKGGEYSLSHSNAKGAPSANESILLPQITSGLKNGEFTFYLQPRFDLNSRKIIGAEALVRWNHPKLGLVMPSVFMQTLEDNGYITKLDSYIWEQVCRTIRGWIDAGRPVVPITLNISKTDILAVDVAAFFKSMVEKYRIPPRYLEMDIAENAYQQAPAAAVDMENILRQSGFRVTLDGFNGDFMALNAIENFHADSIKLDMRFIKDARSGALATILEQAAGMKLSLSAEGIENMDQLTQLRKGGCSEGQGYYLSRPMPIEAFEDELNKR